MRTATSVDRRLLHDLDLGRVGMYAFFFFAAFTLLDPFYTGYGPFRVARDLGPIKYVTVVFGLAATFLVAMGMALRRSNRYAQSPPLGLLKTWPIWTLGIYIVAASLWARNVDGIRETYLQLGVAMLFFPVAVVMSRGIGQQHLVARRFLTMLLCMAPYVLGWTLWKRIEGGQAFHTEVFLFVPLMVYAALCVRPVWLSVSLVLVCLAVGLAGHKNTAYLNVILALAYLAVLGIPTLMRGRNTVVRLTIAYLVLMTLVVVASGMTFLLVERERFLPGGSVAARTETYSAALARFLDSPIWGSGFLGSSLTELDRLEVLGRGTLVTHSDLMDMLAHGGLIGAALLCLGLALLLRQSRRALRASPSDQERGLVHGLIALLAGGLITATFNSPLLTLPVGSMFWFAAGLLWEVATSVEQRMSHRQFAGSGTPWRA